MVQWFDNNPSGQIADFSQLGALGKIGLVLSNIADPNTLPQYQQALANQTQQNLINQTRQNELDKQSKLAALAADPSFQNLDINGRYGALAAIDPAYAIRQLDYQASQEITPYQRAQLAAASGANQITTNSGLPVNNPLIASVINAESGGNPNAVSPKGALGLMQLMPQTAANPGFGITPAQNSTPQENVRVGSEYLGALQQKYGDTPTALAAYNWGTGNVDKWLANGADPSALPKETQNYVKKVLTNQAISGSMAPATAQPLYKGGKPYTENLPAGYQWALNPDGSQVAQKIPGTAPTKDENDQRIQSDAKAKFDETLANLQGYYDELAKQGEIRTQNQGTLANIADYIPNADGFLGVGTKALGDFYGTPASTTREKINAAKSLAAAQYIQAAGLTSGQTNSLAEQERFLSTLGGYNKTYEANQSALANLSKSYGRGAIKERNIKDVLGQVNGFTIRKK